MNKALFKEERSNNRILNFDPLLDKKIAEYFGPIKSAASLVTEETEESIRKFIPGYENTSEPNSSPTSILSKESIITSTNINSNLSYNKIPETKYKTRKERKMMKKNTYSFGRFLKTSIGVTLFLVLFACSMFLIFYLMISNL